VGQGAAWLAIGGGRSQFLRLFPAICATALIVSQHVITANPATVELSPAPFPAEWILDGCPQAQATAVARSRDGAMTVIAWSCTEGRFRWQYHVDEMAHIGLDAEPGASGGGLVAAEHLSVSRPHSASATRPR
jgi:hypothetical protein